MSTGCLLVVNKTASVRDIVPNDSVIWVDDINQKSIYNGLREAVELINNDSRKVENEKRLQRKCNKEL